MVDREKLKKKGWSEEEIDDAEEKLSRAEAKKSEWVKALDSLIYWALLGVVVLGTVAISVFLTPLVVFIDSSFFLYFVALLLALLLGTVHSTAVQNLHWLTKKHHFSSHLIIPVVALVNFYIVVSQANTFVSAAGIENTHNPWLLGVFFGVGLVLPQTVQWIYKRGSAFKEV